MNLNEFGSQCDAQVDILRQIQDAIAQGEESGDLSSDEDWNELWEAIAATLTSVGGEYLIEIIDHAAEAPTPREKVQTVLSDAVAHFEEMKGMAHGIADIFSSLGVESVEFIPGDD